MSKILKKNKGQFDRSHMNEHNQMEAIDTISIVVETLEWDNLYTKTRDEGEKS